jgi:hypothetical protein
MRDETNLKFDWRAFASLNRPTIDNILALREDIIRMNSRTVDDEILQRAPWLKKMREKPEVQRWVKKARAASEPLEMVCGMKKGEQYRLNEGAAQVVRLGKIVNQKFGYGQVCKGWQTIRILDPKKPGLILQLQNPRFRNEQERDDWGVFIESLQKNVPE